MPYENEDTAIVRLVAADRDGSLTLDKLRIRLILYNSSVQFWNPEMAIETTYSQAREQLKSLMDRAVDDREIILVRRRSGGAVAMIAADDLESLTETAHLLRSPKNAERLLAALARARGDSIAPTLVADLTRDVGLGD